MSSIIVPTRPLRGSWSFFGRWLVRPLLVVAVVAFAIFGVIRAVPSWLGDVKPFEETTVDRSEPTVLQAMRDIAEYHAATGQFQQVVDIEHDVKYVPSFIAGDRTTMLATGSVDAVADLSALPNGAVKISPDGKAVTVTIPALTLSEPRLDPEHTRMIGSDRGIINRVAGAVGSESDDAQELYIAANDKIAQAARETDLLARGEANTRLMLEGTLRSLGFESVTVEIAADPR